MSNCQKILDKGSRGERLSREAALQLSQLKGVAQIHALGKAALQNRLMRFGRRATYVLNLAVNPSNICDSKCQFCHYYVSENDPTAYIMSKEEILAQLNRFRPKEVHITGGLNRYWTYKKSLELIARIRRSQPALFIKAFTAVEIDRFAKNERRPTAELLSELKAAGLDSLTGGGAELFSARMRQVLCPDKICPDAWIAIHHQAHRLAISSNATMLYGLGETDEEIIDHLITLRQAQDKSGGFACFIPLAYQPGKEKIFEAGPTPLENLRMTALARLILDNFKHIKAYWPMIGLETAAIALSFGADDLDGTLGKERIAHAGAAASPEFLSRGLMAKTIKAGGFSPIERGGRCQ